MFAIREARLSLRKEISDLFSTAATFGDDGTAFNIYGEENLRDGAHAVHRPFLFLLDSFVSFQAEHLPVIVLETEMDSTPLQLGTDPTLLVFANIHIFGRTRGERDDMAGAIWENIKSVEIRDFDVDAETVQFTSPLMPISGENYWHIADSPPPSQELRMESSLLNWIIMSCSFYGHLGYGD